MYSEVYRPTTLDDVFGYKEEKEALKKYLTSGTFKKSIILSGPPGIGKKNAVQTHRDNRT